jgi:hypothetical protein
VQLQLPHQQASSISPPWTWQILSMTTKHTVSNIVASGL